MHVEGLDYSKDHARHIFSVACCVLAFGGVAYYGSLDITFYTIFWFIMYMFALANVWATFFVKEKEHHKWCGEKQYNTFLIILYSLMIPVMFFYAAINMGQNNHVEGTLFSIINGLCVGLLYHTIGNRKSKTFTEEDVNSINPSVEPEEESSIE